jgi:hypothetical protein
MNVSWIADFDFLANLAGGAEMSDREAYIYGMKKNHIMQLFTPQSARGFAPDITDFSVISNASQFDLNWILNAVCVKPYIAYLHDYWPLCKYRLFYPMLEKCKKCKNIEIVRKFAMNSVFNIFLSPLHFDAWCFAIPELKDHPHHIHPSPVNLDLFKPDPNIKRNPNAGLVINAAAFKGAKNTIEYCGKHPSITFTFCGGKPAGPLPANCAFIGYVPTPKMPSVFNQASYYVELPDTIQPFNRTVLEARLMEVPHIIINKNIGAASYDWFKSDTVTIRKHIEEAVPSLWKKIEELVK